MVIEIRGSKFHCFKIRLSEQLHDYQRPGFQLVQMQKFSLDICTWYR